MLMSVIRVLGDVAGKFGLCFVLGVICFGAKSLLWHLLDLHSGENAPRNAKIKTRP